MKRIVVQWPRFSPFHLARLTISARHAEADGVELIGLETASMSDLYEWREETGPTSFQRHQAFPGRTYEAISPSEMHDGMLRTLDELDPDVVAIHTYSLPDSRACLEWCKTRGRASVVMTNSKADDAPRATWREWLKSRLIRDFDAAFLAGIPQRAYFEQLGFPPDAIFLGYNVVDNGYFEREAERWRADPEKRSALPGLDDPTPFFLASNRFIARKNLDGLLRAYAAYRSRVDHPFRLIMVGDGELRGALEEQIRRDRIDGVVFTGFQQIDVLPAWYSQAAVFVHPCHIDTWALVVNEAMASGLPVLVSTGAGCHMDLVRQGENGWTFDPKDTDRLAELMVQTAASPSWRENAGNVSKAVVSEWSLDRFAASLLEACRYASTRDRRPASVVTKGLTAVLKQIPSQTAFHTVEF